jgi:hypothetical protein
MKAILVLFGLLLGYTQASAGEVHTPALRVHDAFNKTLIRCFATNVSRHVEEASLTLYTKEGTIPGSPDEPHPFSETITVQPNETHIFQFTFIPGTTTARCSLFGNGVNPRDWRLSICLSGVEEHACLKGD